MTKQNFENLKRLFREWYGSLSVDELVTNHELVKLIEKIESRFLSAAPLGAQYGFKQNKGQCNYK